MSKHNSALTTDYHARLSRRIAASLIPGSAALSLLFAGSAQAANIIVDAGSVELNVGDDACSLIEAINEANNGSFDSMDDCVDGQPGLDTITLPASSSFNLTDANTGGTGLPAITDNLTIAGNSSSITRDAAASAFRILTHTGGALTVNNSTLSGGQLTGMNSGGGILSEDTATSLTLNSVTLSGNSTEAYGGGLSSYVNTTISNSTITGNSAIGANTSTYGGGGGLDLNANATINQTVISNNSAKFQGGGIGVFDGSGNNTVTLNRTTVTGNSISNPGDSVRTDAQGGGIYNQALNFNANFSQITNNSVSGPAGVGAQGGGIYTYASNLSISNSLISGNSTAASSTPEASKGGGISTDASGGTYTIRIVNSVIASNSTPGVGGGIRHDDTDALIIEQSILQGNSAREGGAIATESEHIMNAITLTRIINNSASQAGGGIHADGGYFTITQSTISGNTAGTAGAGIAATHGGDTPKSSVVFVVRSTIANNTAMGNGGGIANINSQLYVNASTLSGNRAAKGGGLFTTETLNVNTTSALTDSTIARNTATANNAGGLDQLVDGYTSLRGNLLADNSPQNCDSTNATEGTWFFLPMDNLASDHSCDSHSGGGIESPMVGGGFLQDLDDNGGPTSTHRLAVASAARDTGHGELIADQRDQLRPIGLDRDTGAFEAGATLLNVTSNNPPTVTVADNEDALLLDLNLETQAGPVEVDTFTAIFSGGGSANDVDSWKVFVDTDNDGDFTDEAPLALNAVIPSDTDVIFDLANDALIIPDASEVRVLVTATFDGTIDMANSAPVSGWTQSAHASVGQAPAAFGLAGKLMLLMAGLFLITLPFSSSRAKGMRMLMLAGVLSMGMTACSDDDDDDAPASTTTTVVTDTPTTGQVVNTNPPVVSGSDIISQNIFRLTLTDITPDGGTPAAATGLPINGAKVTVN